MANVIYNSSDQLPTESGPNARLELSVAGHLFLHCLVDSATLSAIRATATQRIFIGKDGSAIGQLYGIDLLGTANAVYNEGKIESKTDTAIKFSGGGANSVVNSGMITAKGMAIEGNSGNERITNYGTLQTTSDVTNAVLLDLKGGNDFYEGIGGSAIGGIINLGDGNDTAFGGLGDETFSGGKGTDYIDGGAGNDMVDYSEATGGVTVNLSRTTSQNIEGEQGSDTLINIENVTGSAHDDDIIGSTGNNALYGGEGDDILEGGLGSDTLDGGGGINTARYSGAAAAKVDLRKQNETTPEAQPTSGYGSDTLIGITNLIGGTGADHFTGNDANNRLEGKAGNDTLVGGKGNDILDGGTGQNTAEFSGTRVGYLITHNQDGSVTVKDGQEQRDGIDTLKDVRFVKFSDQIVALVNDKPSSVSLSSTSVSESTAVGTSVADLFGSDPDGDKLTYRITSNPDGLFGLDSTGKEIILTKSLDYETATQYTISITADDGYGGEFTKAFTINVRNVVETAPLIRQGTARAENLTGESGNDRLFGLGGNDQLTGQIGNDTLNGGTGNDILMGGAGKDVFVFDQKLSAKSNRDHIQDFGPKDDTIHLSKKVFSKLSKGTLSSKAFVVGDTFKDKDDRILYHKKGGALFYDPDGSGSAKAIQFATISENLSVTHKDFFVI